MTQTPSLRRLCIVLVCAAVGSVGCQGSGVYDGYESGPLSGADVRGLVSGNTLAGAHRQYPYTFYHGPDGTLVGTIYSAPDSGRWRIEGDRYCFKWVEFFQSSERCYRWHETAGGYLLRNVDAFKTLDLWGGIRDGKPAGY